MKVSVKAKINMDLLEVPESEHTETFKYERVKHE